jgi:histidine phosphotransferase ChpT
MAGETIDLRIAEFLAARLCHELVSPIGAISNGLEILEDEPDFAGDAGALIGLSARQAARRLQFYRVAYGSTTGLADDLVRRAAVDLFAEGKVTLEWRLGEVEEAWRKLVINLVLLGSEALPRGGRVILDKAGAGQIAVTAEGEGVRLAEPIPALLHNPDRPDDLSPRTVQAVFTALLARRANTILEVRQLNPNELMLVVKMKP